MKKFDTLEKALGHLGGHLKKSSENHLQMSKTHAALAKAHSDHVAFLKGKFDSMADDDANKSFIGQSLEVNKAMAEHHQALADCHKAQGDHCSTTAEMEAEDPTKNAAAAAPAAGAAAAAAVVKSDSDPVAAMVEDTKNVLVKKAIESLTEDPVVKEKIREMVLAGVQSALGDKLVPTDVRGAMGGNPRPTLVPRPGSPTPLDAKGIDPEMAEAMGA